MVEIIELDLPAQELKPEIVIANFEPMLGSQELTCSSHTFHKADGMQTLPIPKQRGREDDGRAQVRQLAFVRFYLCPEYLPKSAKT